MPASGTHSGALVYARLTGRAADDAMGHNHLDRSGQVFKINVRATALACVAKVILL